MRSLRNVLIAAIATMGLFTTAAGAVVMKTTRGHRVSVTLRAGVKRSHLRGLSLVRSRTSRARASAGGVLLYHGGPVLHSEAPYLIYWTPAGHSIPSSNQTVLNQYLSDVAIDSGGTDNVYAVLTQYSDTSGAASYSQTFGSSQVIQDTHAYPANNKGGCPLATGITACVTDGQLQAEITRLIGVDHLGTGVGAHAPIYFVITPQDVNVCLSGGACSTNNFCAYHGFFNDGSAPVLYSSVPFSVWAGGSVKGCQDDGTAVYQTPDQGSQRKFFGDHGYQIADNLSHELSETITDPLINAWYTSGFGSEVGDLCEAFAPVSNPNKDLSAHAYFPTLAGTAAAGDLVDQFFNGHYYYNQTEWSNAAGDCMATPTT
ncbi:MAG TPA: hypothetical protein VKR21_08565 [Solirubrobacteraceae bacterium]|nr:hypothetical protein [Solirubrobacteraceae bacterium]